MPSYFLKLTTSDTTTILRSVHNHPLTEPTSAPLTKYF
ncbi:hypothetical protein CU035_2089 [Enterococcus faecium]|nr:hypothetical protein [Enterococcus faecium]MBK4793892.1 hypothetical protein [Enterococcus faecium]MBK4796642.1 hypothetical protein [Enterococcus faecium]MBK4804544.1 hypothetical protein [Enterococcus faecium]MBK4817883.1 hypothetical protein [Enterococcus faecium]